MDVINILNSLAKSRPIFYSEADFQHAFAWAAKSLYMCEPRLEVRMIHTSSRASLDLLLNLPGEKIGFEFKYKTSPISAAIYGEVFSLLNQGALDIFRYDCIKDISRLENAIGSGQISRGYFILLTNEPAVWSRPIREGHADDEFKLHENEILGGVRTWGPAAGPGTRKNREDTLTLTGEYQCHWSPFSLIQGEKFGTFNCLVIEVSTPSFSMHSSNKTSRPITRLSKPRANSGRYSKLTEFLSQTAENRIELTFDQVREIVGSLPASAYNHSAYWSNHPSHPPAVAWLSAGWKQSKLDFLGQRIWLERITDHPTHSTKPPQ
ncbi:hypothetical protein C0431_00980 [bacterium]|nr:hypothetical protein [bacterium]